MSLNTWIAQTRRSLGANRTQPQPNYVYGAWSSFQPGSIRCTILPRARPPTSRAQSLTGQVVFVAAAGRLNLPDRRWPVLSVVPRGEPNIECFNHILLGRRLWAFPRQLDVLWLRSSLEDAAS